MSPIEQGSTQMAKTFQIFARRMNDAEWEFYGEFTTEQEFRNELPHIRAQGLSIKRKTSRVQG